MLLIVITFQTTCYSAPHYFLFPGLLCPAKFEIACIMRYPVNYGLSLPQISGEGHAHTQENQHPMNEIQSVDKEKQTQPVENSHEKEHDEYMHKH